MAKRGRPRKGEIREYAPPESVGGRVADLIGRQISLRAFSENSGISESSLRAYIAGKSVPSLDAAIAMAHAAGVRLEWLATGTGPKDLESEPLAESTDHTEVVARHLYAGGYSLAEVAAILGLELNQIREMKESTRSEDGTDPWEEQLHNRQDFEANMVRLLTRQMARLNEMDPLQITQEQMATLDKMRAMADEWQKKAEENERETLERFKERLGTAQLLEVRDMLKRFKHDDFESLPYNHRKAAIAKLRELAETAHQSDIDAARALPYVLMGALYFSMGDFQEAQQCFQRAQSIDRSLLESYRSTGWAVNA